MSKTAHDTVAARRAATAQAEAKKAENDGFESSVLEAAANQAQRILDAAQKQSQTEYDAILAQYNTNAVLAHNTEMHAALRRKEASARQENMKKLLIYRKQLVNGLFAECEEELADFTKTPEYVQFVVDALTPYADKAKDGCTVYLRAGDEAPKAALKKLLPKAEFAADPSIHLGGAKLLCGRILYDETLGQRVREQRAAFLQRCNLHVVAVGTEQADEQ